MSTDQVATVTITRESFAISPDTTGRAAGRHPCVRRLLCFCALTDDFDDRDKEFFKELYEAGIKIIMLPRFLLEMDAFEFSDFRSKNNQAAAQQLTGLCINNHPNNGRRFRKKTSHLALGQRVRTNQLTLKSRHPGSDAQSPE